MKFLFNLFLLLLLATACKVPKKKESQSSTIPPTEIEKIKLSSLNGEPIDMTQYTGKTVFVNFWATWCQPCIEEMPTIRKAKDSLKDKNIEFLFASDETPEQIKNFESEHHYGFNYVTVGNTEDLNILGLPTTFIFEKNGKRVFSEIGYRKWDDKTNIDLLLKIAKPE